MGLLYEKLPPGFSLIQSRPLNSSDAQAADNSAVPPILFSVANWCGPTTDLLRKVIPFPFVAATIGPNSHVGSVIIKPPGKRPYLLSAGSPLVGDFESGTIISPSKIYNQSAGSYIEIIFYITMPTIPIPTKRNNYTRQLVNGAPLYSNTSDPDFISALANHVVVEGRKKATFIITVLPGFSPYIRWVFGSPYDYDNPGNGAVLSSQNTLDDGHVFGPANAISGITVDVPPGATEAWLYDLASSSDYNPANLSYFASLDD